MLIQESIPVHEARFARTFPGGNIRRLGGNRSSRSIETPGNDITWTLRYLQAIQREPMRTHTQSRFLCAGRCVFRPQRMAAAGSWEAVGRWEISSLRTEKSTRRSGEGAAVGGGKD